MSINRKSLLCDFFRNELSESEIRRLQVQLPQHYHLIYNLFILLRNAGAEKEDILKAKIDDGDVMLTLSSKGIAKQISDAEPHYKYGALSYKMKVTRTGNAIMVNSKHVSGELPYTTED